MRDPICGGLTTPLADLAEASGYDLPVGEQAISMAPAVVGTCDMLGLDPLYVACEGRVVTFCSQDCAGAALAAPAAWTASPGKSFPGSARGRGGAVTWPVLPVGEA